MADTTTLVWVCSVVWVGGSWVCSVGGCVLWWVCLWYGWMCPDYIPCEAPATVSCRRSLCGHFSMPSNSNHTHTFIALRNQLPTQPLQVRGGCRGDSRPPLCEWVPYVGGWLVNQTLWPHEPAPPSHVCRQLCCSRDRS